MVNDHISSLCSTNNCTDVVSGNAELKSVFKLNGIDTKFNMCYLNARSLCKQEKFAELLKLFDGVDTHVIAVTETWLRRSITSKSVEIPGFSLIRNDRLIPENSREYGGGVAFYVAKHLRWNIIDMSTNGTIEYLFIEIISDVSKMLIGVVYNPPSNKLLAEIEIKFSDLVSKYDHILITGDFNMNILKDSKSNRDFKNMLASLDLNIVSMLPTYFSSFHCSASLLDLLLTSDKTKITNFNQMSVSILDHDILYFSYKHRVSHSKCNTFSYRDYKNLDYQKLLCDLNTQPWGSINTMSNVDDQVKMFNALTVALFDNNVPVKYIKSTGSAPPWFTPQIEKAVINRDLCYRQWKVNKCERNRKLYCQRRNLVKYIVRHEKSKFIHTKLNSRLPSKNLWDNIRNLGLMPDKHAVPRQFTPEQINTHFSVTSAATSHVNSSDLNTNAQSSISTSLSLFSFRNITADEVCKAMWSIKSNAIGYDGISLKFLKIILPYILPYLEHIMNSCLTFSTFPLDWKIAKIIPVAKCSNPKVFSDLRPISLLPCLSKCLEILIRNQLLEHIDNGKFINAMQSGFRSKHSTCTATIKITDDIYDAMDKGLSTTAVFLDFSKAFDMIDHNLLLLKLKNQFKFSPSALKLIENYLSCRKQFVSHNGTSSKITDVLRGVPQGSILGPILFSLFINDISNDLKFSRYHIYADDVLLYASSVPRNLPIMISRLNSDLERLMLWTCDNHLILNPTKTVALKICKNTVNSVCPPLFLGTTMINYVEHVKYLGYCFNSSLTWDNQISCICKSVYYGLKRLKRLGNLTPFLTRKKLIVSLIFSHFSYADLVMSKLTCEQMNRLTVAFNACTRYLHNLSKFDHISLYSRSILGCKFEHYLQYRKCLFMFNLICYRVPEYLAEKITLAKSSRSITLILPHHKTTFRSRSLLIDGAKLWNSLPSGIRGIRSPAKFKETCFNYYASF